MAAIARPIRRRSLAKIAAGAYLDEITLEL
jgi:hypothetical protein